MNFMQMFNMFRNAKNPRAMLDSMCRQNPQMQQMLQQFQNSCGNASQDQLIDQLAQRSGMSREQLIQMHDELLRGGKL